jgi:hypothetical protein
MTAPKGANVTEDEGSDQRLPWLRLMEEVGISPLRRGFHLVLWAASMLLAIVAVVTTVVGIFVGVSMLEIAFSLIMAAVVVIFAANWWRRHLIRKVRWVEGTVTFRTIEPGGMGENGQYVKCQVRLDPPSTITRVATQVGPLDAERLSLGGTMRCLIDRLETFRFLRVYPYAPHDARLPYGRELKFHKA